MERIDTREIVYTILMDVETGNTFSNLAIEKALRKHHFSEKSDRAFITRLAEGVTERRLTLDYVIGCFSKLPVKKLKPAIRVLLRMGIYQMLFMDSVPDAAAVNETVRLTKKHGLAGLSGYVNGVLRSVKRGREEITYPDLSVEYSVPVFLSEKLAEAYPDRAERILKSLYEERPTSLRVNQSVISRDALIEKLRAAGVTAEAGHYTDRTILVSGYDSVSRLPGFRDGAFTVQDESSVAAVLAAGIKSSDTVWDICAAPGGKTTLAAELAAEGMVYSMDLSEDKLSRIEENVERLGLSDRVRIMQHDARAFFDLPKPDVVIADLPCSGLGIMGRKNDIKYHVDEEKLTSLVSLQREILSNIDGYIPAGGTLLFSTCTINPDENEGNTSWFLEQFPDYKKTDERLFLQGVDDCDGFYYAVLRKEA